MKTTLEITVWLSTRHLRLKQVRGPQNSLNSSGHGLYKVSKAFHRDAVPCWLQCFPQLCHVGWMSFWVVDHSWFTWETVERENPSSVAVLDTLKPVHLAPTTLPRSKALKLFVLPIHPLNVTHTQSMSQLSQGLKILIESVSRSSTLIEVDLTCDMN